MKDSENARKSAGATAPFTTAIIVVVFILIAALVWTLA